MSNPAPDVTARDRGRRSRWYRHRETAGRARRAGPASHPARHRPRARGDRTGRRRRHRRGAGQRLGRRSRRTLQLRQPALPPLAHRLATIGVGATGRGRAQRGRACDREQPVRLRPGGRADHSGDAACRDPSQATAESPDVARLATPWRPCPRPIRSKDHADTSANST